MPKYNRIKAILDDDLYFDMFQERGQKFFTIHKSKTFENLKGERIPIGATHLWMRSDKLHKLSQKYYGTNEYWWVISIFNKKPTDTHFTIGDEVYIPSDPIILINMIEGL